MSREPLSYAELLERQLDAPTSSQRRIAALQEELRLVQHREMLRATKARWAAEGDPP